MDADELFDALIETKNDAIKQLQSSLHEARAGNTTLLIDKEKQDALIKQLQRDNQQALQAAERVFVIYMLCSEWRLRQEIGRQRSD